ncbi:MAG: acetylornithine aminotransferase [Sclerophora amabilis]|nr:MAG: acetylornithine aminotransferase [Sclerophora amabilis]
MAFRTCARHAGRVCASRAVNSARFTTHRRNASSQAAAAVGSNLSSEAQDKIHKDASLPTPDPPIDSATNALVSDQLPYMVPTYVRPPPMFVKGEGCYLWDVENRRYLDFTAGIAVNALGHCDPETAKLLAQQSKTLVHTSNLYHNPWTGSLSKLLVTLSNQASRHSGSSNPPFSRAFISNSGSEANEAALKFARKVGKTRSENTSIPKNEILSFHSSFHGRTLGSLSATPNPKYQAPFLPLIPGFVHGDYNDTASIASLITPQTCGVIVEPIQGEGGVNVASTEFLSAIRQRCNETGAVLIYDEIQCGLSRTGSLWAHQSLNSETSSDISPDILTTAKALGNGYPIGATLVSEAVASAIVTGDHGTTFGGNPLGSRVAHSIVSRLASPTLQSSVLAKEKIFRSHFARLQQRFPGLITEIRGKGLILGLQLSRDPTPVITAARERGLLVITCGTDTLRFVPPLVVSDQEIDEGMAVLEEAMGVVFKDGEDVEGTLLKGK